MRICELVQTGTETITNTIMVDDYDQDGNVIGQHEETVTKEVPVMETVYRDMTAEEQAETNAQQEEIERQQFEQEMANQGSDQNKLELLLASIPTDTKPADRPGYRWKMLYNAEGNSFGWEEVVDPYYVPTADGDFTRPIRWIQSMTVEFGKWYYDTDPQLPKECVVAGIADTFGEPWLV